MLLIRPHDPLCTPPLSWKARFAHEALEWYNKNKAHNSFAHYKMLTTMMANKVHYKDEYYCHVNFVAVDTVCGRTICKLFFAEVKLSQDAQNNEILACCILSPQAWTGCLSCASTMEILHPPPSEYNVGIPVSDDVSSGSLSVGVTDQIYEDYLDGKTPSMKYSPLKLCFIGRKYRDEIEGAEVRACLEDHFMKTGERYDYVKFLSCESIAPDDSFWRHYNFLAKRADLSNAELEVLFAEKLFERQAGAYPDAPAMVCCSLGPAKLVPVEGNFSEVGDFYKVTIPGYRRGIDARQCFCPVRHPSPDLYSMHRKRPPFYQAPREATETQAS